MGLLDTLLGRTKPVRPDLDALFALPSAAVTLQTAAGLLPTGEAGICWKPPAGRPVEDVQREMAELLEIPDEPGDSAGSQSNAPAGGVGAMTQAEDSFGYRWLLLQDSNLDDLVARVHLVNSTLTDNGWGPQLLCSVFAMKPGPDAGADAKPFFVIYLYKRGTFYPFVPTGEQHRDSEYELWLRSTLGSDLPVEQDLSRWFPLWDMPLKGQAGTGT